MLLPIPTYTPNDFGLTIYKPIQLSDIVNLTNDKGIVIDFKHTKFLHCMYLAGLFGLIRNWKMFGRNVEIRNFRL